MLMISHSPRSRAPPVSFLHSPLNNTPAISSSESRWLKVEQRRQSLTTCSSILSFVVDNSFTPTFSTNFVPDQNDIIIPYVLSSSVHCFTDSNFQHHGSNWRGQKHCKIIFLPSSYLIRLRDSLLTLPLGGTQRLSVTGYNLALRRLYLFLSSMVGAVVVVWSLLTHQVSMIPGWMTRKF